MSMSLQFCFFLILASCSVCLSLADGCVRDNRWNDSVKVVVEELSGQDCEGQTLQQDLTCNSFVHVLNLLSQSPSNVSVEVIINEGSYTVEGSFHISRDVLIRGREGHSVEIDLLTQGSTPPVFVYSLSFRNTKHVSLCNIDFSGSNGVIGFDNVSKVEVSSSSFRNFVQGAVDVYNSHDITVSNCTFENNGPVTVTKFFPWRGHAGGLSVAFNYLEPLDGVSPSVLIRDSYFRNNSVQAAVSGQQTTSQLLRRNLATGRGGGCAVNINSVTSIRVAVDDCVFERNFAISFGGGLYFAWDRVSGHLSTLNRTVFIENESPGGAGGLELGFARGGGVDNGNQVFAYGVRFIRNKATYGGGAYVFIASTRIEGGAIGNFVSFEDCVFENNTAIEYGGAVGLILPSANVIFDNRDNIRPITFESCTFFGNDGGRGGVVSTSYLPLRFDGNNTLSWSRGSTLTVLGALVRLHGKLEFYNNDASSGNGGALHTISLGQLELVQGSQMVFQNNTGNLGAAIVVDSLYIPPLFSELLYNPLCMLLLEDRTLSLNELEPSQVSLSFSHNKAVVGAAVYTNQIGLCSWTGALGGNKPYFNKSSAYRWPFINYSDNNVNSAHVPESSNPLYYVQTTEGQLYLAADTNLTAFPGEKVQVEVSVRDELNLPTVSVLRFSDIQTMTLQQKYLDIEFVPSVISLTHVDEAGEVSVLINATGELSGSDTVIVQSLLQYNVESAVFSVRVSPCPPGYVITQDSTHTHLNICQCDLQNEGIVNCNGLNIQIKDGYWASIFSMSTYPCPHHYCRCHVVSSGPGEQRCSNVLEGKDSDSQCRCDRHGVLCGSCRSEEAGFSALLNRCVSCGNISALLIAALVVADTVVFVVLMLMSVQFPAWLYPCLFYVQILPYLAEHFSPAFKDAYNPLYYITSASSFYFVYDFCLLHGLSPVLAYFFRYIPLLLAMLVCPLVMIIARCCTRWERLKRHSLKKCHGLWWIVTFMYPHVVYTSMNILNCPIVQVDPATHSPRWYVSGDVECFKGRHLPLAVFAILVLLVCFLAIPLTAFIVMRKTKMCWSVLDHLSKPLVCSFRSQFKWWYSVELLRRFLVILFVVAFPANNYPAMVIISVLIVLTGLTRPYSSALTNLLDMVLSVNVLILLLIRNTRQANDDLSAVSFHMMKSTDSSSCADYDLDLSTLSYILLPFFYLPLLLTLVAFCVWLARLLRTSVTRRKHSRSVTLKATNRASYDREDEFYSSDNMFGREGRAFTRSEINMDLYRKDDDDASAVIVTSPYNLLN